MIMMMMMIMLLLLLLLLPSALPKPAWILVKGTRMALGYLIIVSTVSTQKCFVLTQKGLKIMFLLLL